MVMIVLDATIVNVALPAIKEDLDFSQSDLAWVVNAYLIAFGGCVEIGMRVVIGCAGSKPRPLDSTA